MRRPWFFVESELAVVPPAVELGRLFEQAEAVGEAQGLQLSERGALGFAHQHLARPGDRVAHVAVFRGDVEVAQHGELGPARQFFLAARRPALRTRRACSGICRNPPLARWGRRCRRRGLRPRWRRVRAFVRRRSPECQLAAGARWSAEYGYAVIGFLAGVQGGIAGGLQFGLGKTGVLGLGLLQAHHVGLLDGQPARATAAGES